MLDRSVHVYLEEKGTIDHIYNEIIKLNQKSKRVKKDFAIGSLDDKDIRIDLTKISPFYVQSLEMTYEKYPEILKDGLQDLIDKREYLDEIEKYVEIGLNVRYSDSLDKIERVNTRLLLGLVGHLIILEVRDVNTIMKTIYVTSVFYRPLDKKLKKFLEDHSNYSYSIEDLEKIKRMNIELMNYRPKPRKENNEKKEKPYYTKRVKRKSGKRKTDFY